MGPKRRSQRPAQPCPAHPTESSGRKFASRFRSGRPSASRPPPARFCRPGAARCGCAAACGTSCTSPSRGDERHPVAADKVRLGGVRPLRCGEHRAGLPPLQDPPQRVAREPRQRGRSQPLFDFGGCRASRSPSRWSSIFETRTVPRSKSKSSSSSARISPCRIPLADYDDVRVWLVLKLRIREGEFTAWVERHSHLVPRPQVRVRNPSGSLLRSR